MQLYHAILNTLQAGDMEYMQNMDRLRRNYEKILQQWRMLTKEKGIDMVGLDMP